LRGLFFENKNRLWPGHEGKDTEIQKDSTLLSLKLIAAGILMPRVERKGQHNEEKWVVLGWNVLQGMTADRIDRLWATIPILLP
jgi:hypothetical protein